MKFLKQSTAVVIPFGPTLDPSDGVTLVTSLVSALDHASTGIFVCKNGGAAAVRHATVTASSYDAYGSYLVTLDTTDTNTLGRLRVMFAAAASCLPIWEDFTVLPANVFDSLVSGSDNLQVDSVQVSGTAQTARDLGASVLLSSGTGTGQVSLSSGAVKTQEPIKKNTALAGLPFLLIQSADHVSPKTGATVTATRSIDGAAFGACSNSVSEVANGIYKINLSAGDLNGDTITLQFTAPGADARFLTLLTTP